MSGTFFRENFVIKIFLRSFFLFCCLKKSSCKLMEKECTFGTGKLPTEGVCMCSVARINESPDMTSAVYRGC